CLTCSAGFYCSGDGNSAVTGICADGYYCPGGCSDAECLHKLTTNCSVPYEDGGQCPLGTFCETNAVRGAYRFELCAEGFYANETGLTACVECPPGYYCSGVGTILPVLCPP
ncbi:Flagellar attachment zone protein 1, partial [Diplonema papillatum]